MHRWFARVQGNLDDCRGHLLSAGLNEFLASTRALGTESVTVSFGQCGHACSVRHSLVAGGAPLTRERRVVWSSPLDAASGATPIWRTRFCKSDAPTRLFFICVRLWS